MKFKIVQIPEVPTSGVTVELKPTGGKKEGWLQSGDWGTLREYAWTMSTFTGQHGDPFGVLWAENIDQAYEECRSVTRCILQRKRAYEEFHESRR